MTKQYLAENINCRMPYANQSLLIDLSI